MTHSSKANREMMHLLDVERCCWKPAWWFSLSWIPGEPQAESGRDLHAEVRDCFLGRYQDSPVLLHRPPQAPSSGGNPYSIQWLLGQGTVVYGRRQWGHWQWSSTALIHHSRLQSGLCQILGGVFPFFSSVCGGALENEVAVECFNGSH